MKISHDTPDLLILDDIPWITGLLMAGFILAFVGPGLYMLLDGDWKGLMLTCLGGGMGVIAFFGFVRRTQLVLNRETGLVRLRSRSLFGYRERIFNLSDISRARLQAHYDSDSGDVSMYRVAIEVTEGPDQGVHPVSPVYTSGNGPHRAEEVINLWLKNSR